MTRFQIINTVIDAKLTNYGLGTVTNYLEQRGAAKVMREKYENGFIRNKHEFKEELSNVLFDSKRS